MLRHQPTANGSASGVAASRTPWGWAGSAQEFLTSPYERWAASLEAHHLALNGEGPSSSQRDAWRDEFDVLVDALLQMHDPAWNLVFEFELPFEGGRRPDVVVLAGDTVVVLEFKTTPLVAASHVDQVAAYARDVREYHEASHWRKVAGVLVSTGLEAATLQIGDVTVCGRAGLAQALSDCRSEGVVDFEGWLQAPYAPLPSLVSAARRIFQHEHLPHVRRALAA